MKTFVLVLFFSRSIVRGGAAVPTSKGGTLHLPGSYDNVKGKARARERKSYALMCDQIGFLAIVIDATDNGVIVLTGYDYSQV